MPEELWTEFPDIVHEAVIQTIPKIKKCKEAKWLSEEALQIVKKSKGIGGPSQVALVIKNLPAGRGLKR